MKRYNYKNCQSLFGYAAAVHIRSGGRCQLCGCGGVPLDFHLWRQMTVEHLIGKSQGGYLNQIRVAVSERFPDFTPEIQEQMAHRLDEANTITACGFCNSTTSRDVASKPMVVLLHEAEGSPEEVVEYVSHEMKRILERKRSDVKWKLASVQEAFIAQVLTKI